MILRPMKSIQRQSKRYDAENITQSTKGLVFNKESKIKKGNVGPNHVLKVDVTVTGDGVVLASVRGTSPICLMSQVK